MRMLLVDDEMPALQAMKVTLDWKRHGVTAVFTATGAAQAREVFGNHAVDLMICDIEMPGENGLALLEWVRANYPDTVCSFLTCHADFHYAHHALRLGSFDYLMKPLCADELETAVTRMVEKARMQHEDGETRRCGQLWRKHYPVIVEHFWQDVLQRKLASTPEVLWRESCARRLGYDGSTYFMPVLIQVQRWHEELSREDAKLMDFALKNSAEELLVRGDRNGCVLELTSGHFIALVRLQGETPLDLQSLGALCCEYIGISRRYFCCDLCCHISGPVQPHAVAGAVDGLIRQGLGNVFEVNRVFLPGDIPPVAEAQQPPDISSWAHLISAGHDQAMREAIRKLFDCPIARRTFSATMLRLFLYDFTQMLYAVLHRHGIQAHSLFLDPVSEAKCQKSVVSVLDMREWTAYASKRAIEAIRESERTESVVDKVRQYVREHLDEDIGIEDLAARVYLNHDYLNRLFKKETGKTLMEHLAAERLRVAADLLAKTDLPVGTIASKVGYANLAWFSKLFRKHMSLAPQEYRAQMRA